MDLKESSIKNETAFALQRKPLCKNCLLRLFSTTSDKTLNQKQFLQTPGNIVRTNKTVQCWLCEGITDEFDMFLSLIKKALEEYEFSSFVIGTHMHESILKREQFLIELFDNFSAKTLKQSINEYLGTQLEQTKGHLVDFEHPDIMIILDTTFNVVSLQIKPLYIYGRYNKYERGLPQTKWFCRRCRGKGCRYCSYSGKLYPENVEELISQRFLCVSGGSNTLFHGCGREDIDVRCLGNGRPFVLEIKNPKKRSLNLQEISKYINQKQKERIAVRGLRSANVSEIALLKAAEYPKTYRVCISTEHQISKEKLIKVATTVGGQTLEQFTPQRVAQRRANKIRCRKIFACVVESVEINRAILRITAQSGTYIKEFITGDNGRTKPNISGLLNMPCSVDALDVIEIQGE